MNTYRIEFYPRNGRKPAVRTVKAPDLLTAERKILSGPGAHRLPPVYSIRLVDRWTISATDSETGERFDCFTWTRSPQAGIDRAKRDAKDFGRECHSFEARPA